MTTELKTLIVNEKEYNYIVKEHEGELVRSDYSIRFPLTDANKKKIVQEQLGGMTGQVLSEPLSNEDIDEIIIYTYTGEHLINFTVVGFLCEGELVNIKRTTEKSYPEYMYELITKRLGIEVDEMSILEDTSAPHYNEVLAEYQAPKSAYDTGFYAHYANGEEAMVHYNEVVKLDTKEFESCGIEFFTEDEMKYIRSFGEPEYFMEIGMGSESFGVASSITVRMGNGDYFTCLEEYLIDEGEPVPSREERIQGALLDYMASEGERLNTALDRYKGRGERTPEEITEFIENRIQNMNAYGSFDTGLKRAEIEVYEKSVKLLSRKVTSYVLTKVTAIK